MPTDRDESEACQATTPQDPSLPLAATGRRSEPTTAVAAHRLAVLTPSPPPPGPDTLPLLSCLLYPPPQPLFCICILSNHSTVTSTHPQFLRLVLFSGRLTGPLLLQPSVAGWSRSRFSSLRATTLPSHSFLASWLPWACDKVHCTLHTLPGD